MLFGVDSGGEAQSPGIDKQGYIGHHQQASKPSVKIGREGKIESMVLTMDRLGDLDPNALNIAQEDRVTKLAVKYNPMNSEENRLPDIFRTSEFSRVRIRYRGADSLAVAATSEWDLQDLVQMVGSKASNKLESYSIHCQRLSERKHDTRNDPSFGRDDGTA